MKHQIKIIMEYEEGEGGVVSPISTDTFRLYHDEQAIGCIQDLKLHATTKKMPSQLELTFPNLHDPILDSSDFSFQSLQRMVDRYVEDFSRIPGVKVDLVDLEDAPTSTLNPEPRIRNLTEIGTDGDIDHISAGFSWEKP